MVYAIIYNPSFDMDFLRKSRIYIDAMFSILFVKTGANMPCCRS